MEKLALRDFLPGYPIFGEEDDDLFNIYPGSPETGNFRKKELFKERLGPTEAKPDLPGVYLHHQNFLSRFLSPLTLNDSILLFHQVGTGKCVHPDTIVYVDRIPYRIEDLWIDALGNRQPRLDNEGEWLSASYEKRVLSFNERKNRIESCEISEFYRQHVDEFLYKITLENNEELICTGKHKLFQNGDWIEASKLDTCKEIATFSNIGLEYKKINKLENFQYSGYVYDLEIKNHHNYFANNILTHNTCTSIAIAETVKLIVDMSKFLTSHINPTLVIVKGGNIRRNFIEQLSTTCTAGEYMPENYENLTDKEQVRALNRKVETGYDITTFRVFAGKLQTYSDDFLRKEYSNRTIIIDEVHNVRIKPRIKVGAETKTLRVYENIHRLLHVVENCKIVLLTATPMRDRPEEFASIMNLILPLDRQLPTGKEFVNYYFKNDNLINTQELSTYIRGKVSVLRAMESELTKVYEGSLDKKANMIKLNTVESKMSEFQSKYYEIAYRDDTRKYGEISNNTEEDDDEEGRAQGLYDSSRQASLFVFPDGSYGGGFIDKTVDPTKPKSKEKRGEQKGAAKYIEKRGPNDFALSDALKKELIYIKDGRKATPQEILDNIRKLSSKYADAIETILSAPDENAFVYCKLVQGSGAILFGELLKLFGFSRARSKDNFNEEHPRYAIITGETSGEAETKHLIDNIFNNKNNKYGKKIRVIVGSQTIGEGKSLKNIRQVHILTPHWNNSETEQAIGRGVRAFSHNDLSPEERTVSIYRWSSVWDKKIITIDETMYKVSEDKDILMKKIERLCKIYAVDCAENYQRNRLPTDKNGSRECDYVECEYQCANIDPEFVKIAINLEDECGATSGVTSDASISLITDTYNNYYAEKEIKCLSQKIKELFRKRFSYDLTELLESFKDISLIIIIRALKSLIDRSEVIVNRYGLPCYLREDRNLYFLVDEVSLPNYFTLSYYVENPTLKTNRTFKNNIAILQDELYDEHINIIKELDPKTDKVLIFRQIGSLSLKLQEELLENIFVERKLIEVGDFEDITDELKFDPELSKVIYNYFETELKHVITKDPSTLQDIGYTISTLYRNTKQPLRCIIDDDIEWHDCDEKIESLIVKIDEKGGEKKIVVKPKEEMKFTYMYKGAISRDNKGKETFRILSLDDSNNIKKTSKGDIDKRHKSRTPVCNSASFLLIKLAYIAISLNIPPPINITITDKNKVIADIEREFTNIEENPKHEKVWKSLESFHDPNLFDELRENPEKLKIYYYWIIKAAKRDICDTLEKWFKNRPADEEAIIYMREEDVVGAKKKTKD